MLKLNCHFEFLWIFCSISRIHHMCSFVLLWDINVKTSGGCIVRSCMLLFTRDNIGQGIKILGIAIAIWAHDKLIFSFK